MHKENESTASHEEPTMGVSGSMRWYQALISKGSHHVNSSWQFQEQIGLWFNVEWLLAIDYDAAAAAVKR